MLIRCLFIATKLLPLAVIALVLLLLMFLLLLLQLLLLHYPIEHNSLYSIAALKTTDNSFIFSRKYQCNRDLSRDKFLKSYDHATLDLNPTDCVAIQYNHKTLHDIRHYTTPTCSILHDIKYTKLHHITSCYITLPRTLHHHIPAIPHLITLP